MTVFFRFVTVGNSLVYVVFFRKIGKKERIPYLQSEKSML